MKERIIKSNKYKHYMKCLNLYTGAFIFIIIILLMLLVSETDNLNGIVESWSYIGPLIGVFSMLFIPFILFYGCSIISIRRNVDKYTSYIGIITSIETSQFIRTAHRNIAVKIEGFTDLFYMKIYRGELYDEVTKDKSVEIAFNEKTGDFIVLNVV